ncbi:unnamed protein product [Paramecium sonneborni]|uniref:Ubiquitin-like domain-containing protein n=1 Tax=Paramecium sonneborni TaxID=65129 RepID=A0A8S1R8F0_9CILI|nr:unnamed protein product [Paramecium sonneborni]
MIQFTVSYEGQLLKSECQSFKRIQDYIDKLISTLKLQIQNKCYGLFMNGVELQKDKTLTENKIKNGVTLELKVTKTFEYVFLKVKGKEKSFWPHISLAEKAEILYQQCQKEFNLQYGSFTLFYQGVQLEKEVQLGSYNIISNSIINCENNDVIKQDNSMMTVQIQYNNTQYQISINRQSLVSDLEQKIKEQFKNIQQFLLLKDGVQLLQSNQKIETLNAKYIEVSQQINQNQKSQEIVIFLNYVGQNTPIEISLDTLIQELLETSVQLYSIKDNVILKLNDQILPNNQTIGQLQIPKGSILTVEVQKQIAQSQEIVIFLNYVGQNTPIEISLDTLIQELLETSVQLYSIKDNVILKLNDQILPNNQTIGQLQIPKGSILTVEVQKQIAQSQEIVIFLNYVGQNTPIEISLDTLIQELIETSVQLYSIKDNVILKLNDQILPNNQTIGQLQIPKGSILTVEVQKQIAQSQEIVIFLNYVGQNTPIEISLDTLIQELIETSVQLYSIKDNVILKLNDQILPNNQTIGQLQIPKGSILTVEVQKQIAQSQEIVIFLNYVGQNTPIEISLDTLIQELIETSVQLYSIKDNVILKLNDQILPNNQTIGQLQIPKGSILTVEVQKQIAQSQEIVIFLNYVGQNTPIEISLDTLIQELIETSVQLYSIKDNVILKLNDQILPNNQTIGQLQIPKGSILTVEVQKQIAQSQEIVIFLNYVGQNTPIEISLDTLIQELIETSVQLYSIKDNVILKLNDQILPNNQTIGQLQIPKGSILTVEVQKQIAQSQEIVIFLNYVGQNTPIEISLDTLIQELIETSVQLYSIKDNVILKLNDQILPNNQTIGQLQIPKGSILTVEVQKQIAQSQEIVIFLNYVGQNTPIEISLDTLIQELIETSVQLYSIKDNVILKLNDQILPNNQTIGQLQIPKGSILTVEVQKQIAQSQEIVIFLNYVGQNTPIEISLDTLIQELIETSVQLYSIKDNVILKLNDQILPNNQTIGQLQIPKGSILTVEILKQSNQQNLISLIIQFDQNQPNKVDVNIDAYVSELAQELQKQYNLPQIKFQSQNGQILNHNQTFRQQNVVKGQILYINKIQQNPIDLNLTIQLGDKKLDMQILSNVLVYQLEQQFISELKLEREVKLFYNNQMLNSNETLQKFQIVQGSKLIAKFIDSKPIYEQKQGKPLQLIIQYQGETFDFSAQEDTSTQQLIESVAKKIKINTSFILQTESGIKLKLNQTLGQQGIITRSVLFLIKNEEKNGKQIKILIDYRGQKFPLDIDNTKLVQEVITYSQQNLQIQGQIQLKLEGNQILNSNDTLANQNVQKGNVLMVEIIPQALQNTIINQNQQSPSSIGNQKKIIIILDIDGERRQFQCFPDSLVSDLLIELQRVYQIQQKFNLSLEGLQILQPNLTISAQNVKKGSLLYLIPSQNQINPNQNQVNPIQNQINQNQNQINPNQNQVNPIYNQINQNQNQINPNQHQVNSIQNQIYQNQNQINPNQNQVNPIQNQINPIQIQAIPTQIQINPTQNQENLPNQGKNIKIKFSFNNKIESINVQDDFTVKEFIDHLQCTYEIQEQFQLSLEGNKILDEKLTLAEQKVQNGNNLIAVFKEKPQQSNFILILKHQNFALQIEANPDSFGSQLFQIIQQELKQKFNIQQPFQIFVEGKVPLDFQKSLRAQNFQKGTSLQICFVSNIYGQQSLINNQYYQQPFMNNMFNQQPFMNNINNQQPFMNNINNQQNFMNNIYQQPPMNFGWNQNIPQPLPNLQNNTKKQKSQDFGVSPNSFLNGQPQQDNRQSLIQQPRFLSQTQSNKLQIYLKYLNNSASFELEQNIIVADLERFCQDHFKIQQPIQIVRQGQVLDSSSFLNSFNLQINEILDVVVKQTSLCLRIQVLGQIEIDVEIDYETKVFEMIDQLKQKYNIIQPTDLMQNQKQLSLDKSFKELNVANNSYLILKNRLQTPVGIFKIININNTGLNLIYVNVRDRTNIIQIEIAPTADVLELERRFKEKTGQNSQCSFQFNNGMILKSGYSLAQYGIVNNSEVLLIR